MNLVKEHWTKEDKKQFQKYLSTFGRGEENGKWEQRIVNTKLSCLAIPSPQVKKIVNEIYKGNFLEFLDLWLWENFTNTVINGGLICKIKDFDLMKKYLLKYANKADSWATCDVLKFKITEENKFQFYNLSQELIKSKKPFVKRIGLLILLKMIKDESFLEKTFKVLNLFQNETEYYVNMMNAWIVAEAFTHHREKTLKFLQTNKLNKFTINKAVQKCRDSFRISPEDKEMLLKFKQK